MWLNVITKTLNKHINSNFFKAWILFYNHRYLNGTQDLYYGQVRSSCFNLALTRKQEKQPKNTKKRNSISWKTTRNYRDLHEKKIPDVQNLEDETKWDLNVSLGLVSFICGHLGTLYDDDDQSCWYKVTYTLKKKWVGFCGKQQCCSHYLHWLNNGVCHDIVIIRKEHA